MSIIVAVKKEKSIVMASDSQYSFGTQIVPIANHRSTKIRPVGDALLGASGWGLYDNILDDYLEKNSSLELQNPQQIFRFFLEFWKQLRKEYTYVNDQCAEDDNSPFADLDSSFLIANQSGIFVVGPDISVTPFYQYYAIGSGYRYSLGALQVLYDSIDDPRTLARKAVAAAMEFDLYCGGEIDVLEVSP